MIPLRSTGGAYIFVFETLMKEGELEKALHTNHPKAMTHYALEGWKRVTAPGPSGADGYDTLVRDPASTTKGDVINCSTAEVRVLVAWENKYNLLIIGKYRGWPLRAFLWKKPVQGRVRAKTRSLIEPLANAASDRIAGQLRKRFDKMIGKIHQAKT
jgi:hypothetical protein